LPFSLDKFIGERNMRIRYRYVTYRYIDGTQQQLERHYRQLLHDALRQSQQSLLQRSATWRPLADIRESADMLTVKIELAGMNEEDIDVTLYEDALVVSGERHDDPDPERSEQLSYHEAQIRYGPFRVEVLIHKPIDREGILARYENGFLWVDLPKLPENRPERIRIKRDKSNI
jgi:HSP20 family molecular chaperone IbpA